jgi:hypothetical protein
MVTILLAGAGTTGCSRKNDGRFVPLRLTKGNDSFHRNLQMPPNSKKIFNKIFSEKKVENE